MSREALAKVIQRSISDGGFRRQLATDPTGALRGYDLSSDEFAALRSGDSTRLSALGVEQRMSKAFTLAGDAATGDSVSKVVSSDLGASWTGAVTAAGGNAAISAQTGEAGAMSNVNAGAINSSQLADNAGATSSGALASGDASDTDPVIADTTGAGRDGAVITGSADHALGDDTDPDGPQWFHVLTPADGATHDVLITDDGASGASLGGDSVDGPTIQE